MISALNSNFDDPFYPEMELEDWVFANNFKKQLLKSLSPYSFKYNQVADLEDFQVCPRPHILQEDPLPLKPQPFHGVPKW